MRHNDCLTESDIAWLEATKTAAKYNPSMAIGFPLLGRLITAVLYYRDMWIKAEDRYDDLETDFFDMDKELKRIKDESLILQGEKEFMKQ